MDRTGTFQPGRSRTPRTGRRVPAVHAEPAARASAVRSLLLMKMRNLQDNSKNNLYADHPAEQCTKALGDTRSVAREVSLDTLHINTRAGRNGNKHAIVRTHRGVLTAAAPKTTAAATVDASSVAAADAEQEAVKLIVDDDIDDAALGAVKAVVKMKYSRIPAFHQFKETVTHLKTKNMYLVQRQYQLGATIRPLKSLQQARADKA